MTGIIIPLVLIACFVVALAKAASNGYTIPVKVCLALIVVGALVLLAPTGFSFLLQLFGREPRISHDGQTTCRILGGIMAMVGIIASIFSTRSSGTPPK